MLIPVLNVNLGICNYQSFNKAFCSLIHDDRLALEDDTISTEENDYGVALRTINAKTHLNKYVDTVELIAKNKDLE